MTYIEGFVASVPSAQKDAYRQYADRTAAVFKDHGALKVTECWGDDVPDGKVTSFPMAVKKEPDETVVFGWIEWPSRAARDVGMEKSLADARFGPDQPRPPMDGQRLIFGGFEVIVSR